jgi:hypothetical protein
MEARRQEVKQEQEKREQEERDRLEAVRAEFDKSRQRLTEMSNGTLKDKSAQEVKKLVDEWRRQESLRWQLAQQDHAGFLANFSAGTFYKIFGKPERQQFLSSNEGFLTVGYYYFLYRCKDGLVQIQVSASLLDDDGVVMITDLNIL